MHPMSDRNHAAHISALHESLQAVEVDFLQVSAALSSSTAMDNFAKFSEPASINSRVKDLKHELELAMAAS